MLFFIFWLFFRNKCSGKMSLGSRTCLLGTNVLEYSYTVQRVKGVELVTLKKHVPGSNTWEQNMSFERKTMFLLGQVTPENRTCLSWSKVPRSPDFVSWKMALRRISLFKWPRNQRIRVFWTTQDSVVDGFWGSAIVKCFGRANQVSWRSSSWGSVASWTSGRRMMILFEERMKLSQLRGQAAAAGDSSCSSDL